MKSVPCTGDCGYGSMIDLAIESPGDDASQPSASPRLLPATPITTPSTRNMS
jgi:hypothetical protein